MVRVAVYDHVSRFVSYRQAGMLVIYCRAYEAVETTFEFAKAALHSIQLESTNFHCLQSTANRRALIAVYVATAEKDEQGSKG